MPGSRWPRRETRAWDGPELVAPGVIFLPDRNETFPAEDPVTGDLWFSVYEGLWVSPDESWMILVVTEHPDGLGGDDLFVVRRQGDGWGALVHAGPELNSEEYEYGPTLSADGRHVYFTSHRGGTADVYRAAVERFRDLDGVGDAE